MQTTKQVLDKLTGSKFIKCSECKKIIFELDEFKQRQIEDDLIEVGLECPNCSAWYHSYFANDDLKNVPKPGASREERRKYSLKFQKFNRKIRRRFNMKKINGRWVTDG